MTEHRSWQSRARAAMRRVSELHHVRQHGSATVRILRPPPPSAFAKFGARSTIVPPARVTTPEGIEIGEDVFIDEHGWLSVIPAIEGLDPRFTVGSRTRIGRFCSIACCGDIEIGTDVVMSERVFIGDTFHEYEDVTEPVIRQPMAQPEKVIIGRGAFLGIAAVVVHGVTIGEQAYVGPGAVVTADVPARSVVIGNPARVVKSYDERSGSWLDVRPAAGDRREAVGL